MKKRNVICGDSKKIQISKKDVDNKLKEAYPELKGKYLSMGMGGQCLLEPSICIPYNDEDDFKQVNDDLILFSHDKKEKMFFLRTSKFLKLLGLENEKVNTVDCRVEVKPGEFVFGGGYHTSQFMPGKQAYFFDKSPRWDWMQEYVREE